MEPMERTMNRILTCPLSRLRAGQAATVRSLAGGYEFQHRLACMGLHVGCTVKVLRPGALFGGPVLVALGQTRLAIGRGMAEKILVALPPQ